MAGCRSQNPCVTVTGCHKYGLWSSSFPFLVDVPKGQTSKARARLQTVSENRSLEQSVVRPAIPKARGT